MSDVDDEVTWLRAIWDEDERVARAAFTVLGGRWKVDGGNVEIVGDTKGRSVFEWTVTFDEGSPSEGQREHIARHDPARVLREVEAKRAILDWCVEVIGDRDLSQYDEFGSLKDDKDALAVTLAVETVKLLASRP